MIKPTCGQPQPVENGQNRRRPQTRADGGSNPVTVHARGDGRPRSSRTHLAATTAAKSDQASSKRALRSVSYRLRGPAASRRSPKRTISWGEHRDSRPSALESVQQQTGGDEDPCHGQCPSRLRTPADDKRDGTDDGQDETKLGEMTRVTCGEDENHHALTLAHFASLLLVDQRRVAAQCRPECGC